jgi:hypothetical protein
METEKEKEFYRVVKEWEKTVLPPFHEELSQRLSELEHSALYSSIPHCFRSFYEIYHEILPALLQTPTDDYEKLHDYFYEIGGIAGALQNIKIHITDAEAGFNALLKLLAEKSESNSSSPENRSKT